MAPQSNKTSPRQAALPGIDSLHDKMATAVAGYWITRSRQNRAQGASGSKDYGARAAVTGGAQMDGFVDLLAVLMEQAGVPPGCIYRSASLELPGFFRPTKEWDILAVKGGQLLAAIEVKSQAGPSFGNNFNNRTEEAMGSALDLWTAYREGVINPTLRPWVGYLFMLEDCAGSRSPVAVREPHFKVMKEFVGASYRQRYELFCRKLVREQHYSAACFLISSADDGRQGRFTEPAADLTSDLFARSLMGHLKGCL